MKSRTQFLIVVALVILILGITWFSFSTRNQASIQTFPATVNRDCAPWDGAAFTISIRYDPTTTITVSIWQSPDIHFPTTFSFPDETGQTGYAYVLPELDPLEELSGEVFFLRVDEGMPIEGRFNFTSERGGQFEGRFIAEWGNEVIYCG